MTQTTTKKECLAAIKDKAKEILEKNNLTFHSARFYSCRHDIYDPFGVYIFCDEYDDGIGIPLTYASIGGGRTSINRLTDMNSADAVSRCISRVEEYLPVQIHARH